MPGVDSEKIKEARLSTQMTSWVWCAPVDIPCALVLPMVLPTKIKFVLALFLPKKMNMDTNLSTTSVTHILVQKLCTVCGKCGFMLPQLSAL